MTYERAAYAALLVLGFTLHIWDVGSRAMHGDEAVHAWFSWQLYNGTGYAYDPVYHGPLQFLVTAAFFFLFGVSNTTGRLMAVLFGTALIFLPYFLREVMGRRAALLAALFITISPSLFYDSRLERDDIFTAFFALTGAVAIFGFLRTRRVRFLYVFAASMALSLTAMENTYITLFVFGSYLGIVAVSELLMRTESGRNLQAFWLRTGPAGALRPAPLGAFLGLVAAAFLLTVWRGWYLPVPLVLGLGLILFVHRQTVLGWSASEDGSLVAALKGVPAQVWLNVLTIVVAILFLCFSTFGSNLHGIWDSSQPLFNAKGQCPGNSFPLNPCRKDMVGGLFYWLSQHKVARGGQPWFYYTFLFGLYEQIAVVFGLAGIVWFLRRPTPFTTFLTFWAVLMLGIYSWAGEKFPWLMIHPLLPFLLIGAMFVVDMLRAGRPARYLTVAVLILLGILELHSAYEVNYVNGADPVEMMVYVQSSPDTPKVAANILSLSNKVTNGPDLKVTIDTEETWPFAWYLRDMSNAAYVNSTQLLTSPYTSNPVILVDQTHQPSLVPKLHGYTGHLYRLRWWFPEDYKTLTWSSFFHDLVNPGYWRVVWDWLASRRPFGPKGAVWFYYYVKTGLATPF